MIDKQILNKLIDMIMIEDNSIEYKINILENLFKLLYNISNIKKDIVDFIEGYNQINNYDFINYIENIKYNDDEYLKELGGL